MCITMRVSQWRVAADRARGRNDQKRGRKKTQELTKRKIKVDPNEGIP